MSDIDAESTAVLETCTAETATALVAWAIGVRVLSHAMHFYRLPPEPRSVAPIMCGGTVGRGGRMYEATAYRAVVYSGSIEIGGGRDIHAAATWPQVCALVTAARVGPDLHRRIVEAMDRRRSSTRSSTSWHRKTDADLAQDEAFAAVEELCGDLAGEVWDRCRPSEAQQLIQGELF